MILNVTETNNYEVMAPAASSPVPLLFAIMYTTGARHFIAC